MVCKQGMSKSFFSGHGILHVYYQNVSLYCCINAIQSFFFSVHGMIILSFCVRHIKI